MVSTCASLGQGLSEKSTGFLLLMVNTVGMNNFFCNCALVCYGKYRFCMVVRAPFVIDRVVRIVRVIFSKMEIQNAKKYPKFFSKNAKYHPKCRKNSFHCHGNQYGRHILDWEVGIFMTPRIS